MGKKTKRKIRWRRLSLEDESSLTDSSLSGPEGEAAGSHTSEESSSSSSGVFTSKERSDSGTGKQYGQGQRGPRASSNSNTRPRRTPSGKPGNSHHHHHYHHHHFGMGPGGPGQHLYPPPPGGGLFQPPTSPNFYCMGPNGVPRGNVPGDKRRGWPNRRNGRGDQPNQEFNNSNHKQGNNSSNHGNNHHQYPGSDKRFLFIAETCYFNNKEYTKIQTPHQDLLFKKGWLSSRKKDLDGLNVPADRTAEARKLAQEYRAEHPEKMLPGPPRTEDIPLSPTSDQEQPVEDSSDGTGTTSSPEPSKDYQNGWMQDPSLCGDYYPAPAYFIPCEVMDHMGQAYPAMMVQPPYYGSIPWAIVPMPVPVYCYDKQLTSDYDSLAEGMSSLEITEDINSPSSDSTESLGDGLLMVPEGVEKIKMDAVAEVLKDLSKDEPAEKSPVKEENSTSVEEKATVDEQSIAATPKQANAAKTIKAKKTRKGP